MHFVVANIVRPLTQSKRVSFVSLWGGRQVDYFVSLGMLLAKLFLKCFLTTFVHLLPNPSKPPLRFGEGPIPGARVLRTSCVPSNAMRCPKRAPLLGLMQHIGYVRLQLGGEH